ncbi:MAG: hypothetical protein AAGG72_04845 [Pseudomonadota bacterium]
MSDGQIFGLIKIGVTFGGVIAFLLYSGWRTRRDLAELRAEREAREANQTSSDTPGA